MEMTTYPRFRTTVDQDRGPHHGGGRYTQLTDITTDYSDHSPVAWDDLTDEDREWWADNLKAYHEAVVAVAELPQEVRSRVSERLLDEPTEDMDSTVSLIRRLIAEETGEEG